MGDFKTPSQSPPPLPFDSIILVFIFIFPLYFTSQFFMMSIMNERIERKGEILLSTPLRTSSIIIGKALPYFIGMVAICAGITVYIRASPVNDLPSIPVIFFFLANALLIGMVSRSFKENSPFLLSLLNGCDLLPLLPKYLCQCPCYQPHLPPHSYCSHYSGFHLDDHRLSLLHLTFLADGCCTLLHSRQKFQG